MQRWEGRLLQGFRVQIRENSRIEAYGYLAARGPMNVDLPPAMNNDEPVVEPMDIDDPVDEPINIDGPVDEPINIDDPVDEQLQGDYQVEEPTKGDDQVNESMESGGSEPMDLELPEQEEEHQAGHNLALVPYVENGPLQQPLLPYEHRLIERAAMVPLVIQRTRRPSIAGGQMFNIREEIVEAGFDGFNRVVAVGIIRNRFDPFQRMREQPLRARARSVDLFRCLEPIDE